MRFFLLFLTSVALFQSSHAALVSKATGIVGERVVTSREVQVAALLEQALTGNLDTRVLEDLDSEIFKREVSQVLLEWMVFMEAESFTVAAITPQEKESAEEKVAQFLNANAKFMAKWKGLGVTGTELNQHISRKLRSKKFIQFKAKSSVVPVTDREALLYFQQNKNRFGNVAFEKFREGIKSYLAQQQADQRLRDWFGILQKKYGVRHLLLERSGS